MNFNQPIDDPALVICSGCDLLQRLCALSSAASARCARCGEELWRRREDSLNRTLALATAASVLYLAANSVPMLGLTVVGREASTTVFGGAQHLWNNGQALVGALVFLTAVAAPAAQILFILAILLGARLSPAPRWVGVLLRHHRRTQTWSMIEVMLLGVVVALVKIADYATVLPGAALFMLGSLVVVLAAMQVTFEPREIWNRIAWTDAAARPRLSKHRAEAVR